MVVTRSKSIQNNCIKTEDLLAVLAGKETAHDEPPHGNTLNSRLRRSSIVGRKRRHSQVDTSTSDHLPDHVCVKQNSIHVTGGELLYASKRSLRSHSPSTSKTFTPQAAKPFHEQWTEMRPAKAKNTGQFLCFQCGASLTNRRLLARHTRKVLHVHHNGVRLHRKGFQYTYASTKSTKLQIELKKLKMKSKSCAKKSASKSNPVLKVPADMEMKTAFLERLERLVNCKERAQLNDLADMLYRTHCGWHETHVRVCNTGVVCMVLREFILRRDWPGLCGILRVLRMQALHKRMSKVGSGHVFVTHEDVDAQWVCGSHVLLHGAASGRISAENLLNVWHTFWDKTCRIRAKWAECRLGDIMLALITGGLFDEVRQVDQRLARQLHWYHRQENHQRCVGFRDAYVAVLRYFEVARRVQQIMSDCKGVEATLERLQVMKEANQCVEKLCAAALEFAPVYLLDLALSLAVTCGFKEAFCSILENLPSYKAVDETDRCKLRLKYNAANVECLEHLARSEPYSNRVLDYCKVVINETDAYDECSLVQMLVEFLYVGANRTNTRAWRLLNSILRSGSEKVFGILLNDALFWRQHFSAGLRRGSTNKYKEKVKSLLFRNVGLADLFDYFVR